MCLKQLKIVHVENMAFCQDDLKKAERFKNHPAIFLSLHTTSRLDRDASTE